MPNGKIVGLNDKAKETINICDLNRETLLIARKKIINYYQYKIRRILKEYIETSDLNIFKSKIKDVFDEVKSLQKKKNVYSRLGYFMFIKFELFIINTMQSKYKVLLNDLYLNYLNGTY